MVEELPQEMATVLRESSFAYICTINKENQPHITPVFFVFDDEKGVLFFISYLRSQKLRNLRKNPRVSVIIDSRDPVNPFNNRGIMIQGYGEIEGYEESSDDRILPVVMAIFDRFEEKYPFFKARGEIGLEEAEEVLVRITPKRMTYWRGPEFITITFQSKN